MFNSLASFLFGSNTSAIANSETTAETEFTGETGNNREDTANLVDADNQNLIEVTSLTPSIAGASGTGQQRVAIKRGGKNKRNNTRQQNKRKGVLKNSGNSKVSTTSLTTLISSSDSCDEDFDEDEWFIVEKGEEEEVDSANRSDSERENTPVNEVVKTKPANVVPSYLAQQRRLQHINSHSLYSGPRPQKQRNYLQKSRGNTNSRSNGLSVSTLSPSRTVNVGSNANGPAETADGGITRSLYAASAANQQPEPIIKADAATGSVEFVNSNNKMEESWFVTPPPCFTSVGPINMETSPYENLLIEHPSMSVYHCIKSAQEATESFVKLDIGANEKQTERRPPKETPDQRKNTQAVQQRTTGGYRLDKQSVAQLKQELLARTVQKSQSKRERKDICRSAIQRANKVRDVQSKNHTQRRSDRQYSKIVSYANNNRKSATCY